jgi:hypothetical protein
MVIKSLREKVGRQAWGKQEMPTNLSSLNPSRTDYLRLLDREG